MVARKNTEEGCLSGRSALSNEEVVNNKRRACALVRYSPGSALCEWFALFILDFLQRTNRFQRHVLEAQYNACYAEL